MDEKKLIGNIEHKIHPLYLYSRLRSIICKGAAKSVGVVYERSLYSPLFHKILLAEIKRIEKKRERRGVRQYDGK
jgi:hypothetical protein